MSLTTQAGYAHRNLQRGDLTPPFLTLPTRSLFHLLLTLLLELQVRRAQRRFTRLASPRVHRCSYSPPHASGLTFNHLYVACRLHQCLWAGGHFGGNHGEVKSDNDGALF